MIYIQYHWVTTLDKQRSFVVICALRAVVFMKWAFLVSNLYQTWFFCWSWSWVNKINPVFFYDPIYAIENRYDLSSYTCPLNTPVRLPAKLYGFTIYLSNYLVQYFIVRVSTLTLLQGTLFSWTMIVESLFLARCGTVSWAARLAFHLEPGFNKVKWKNRDFHSPRNRNWTGLQYILSFLVNLKKWWLIIAYKV